jgi:hypothetical protein
MLKREVLPAHVRLTVADLAASRSNMQHEQRRRRRHAFIVGCMIAGIVAQVAIQWGLFP